MKLKIILPPEYNSSLFPTGKGITVTGQTVEFDGFTEDQAKEITQRFWRKLMPDGSAVTLKTLKKSKAMTEDEVSLIKNKLPDGYDPKRHSIYKIGAANTKLDRDNDQFTPGYLQAMAKAVNDHGAALLFNHNNDYLIGKVFYATTAQMEGADVMHTELIEYAMIGPDATLPGQPSNTILKNVEDGTLTDASVRFGRWKSEIKEVGGNYIRIIDVPEQGEMVHPETSLVFFPAQIGAGLKLFSTNGQHEPFDFKSFNPTIIHPKKSFTMAEVTNEVKFGEKTLKVTAKLDGDKGEISGLPELQKEYDSALSRATTAEKELTDAKQPYVNSVQNLEGEKGLKKSAPRKEDELKGKTLTELMGLEKDLIAELKAVQPQNQLIAAIPAADKVEGEGEEKKSYAWQK